MANARKIPTVKKPRPTLSSSPTSGAAPLAVGSKEARECAIAAAAAGLDKKALDVEILDVAGRIDYADYLVLMSGTSDRHVASLVHNIEDELRKRKIKAIVVEGLPVAEWVLVDFGGVIVHVFQQDMRHHYDLEGLWMYADRIPVAPPPVERQG